MRKDKHFLAFTNQAAAVMVFAEGSPNLASPMLFGTATVQKVVPSFLVPTFCPSVMPPSPRDGQPHLSLCPGQEVFAPPSPIEITIGRKYDST